MGGSEMSPGVSLRLSLAGAWHVVRGRSLCQFPRVLGLLEALGRAAPGVLSFRHGARLRLGLQAAVVVRLLQEAQPQAQIFDAIDSFFPEGEAAPGGAHGPATPRELALVGEAQENFRELVLGLVADPRRRQAYLQGPAEQEYGERFLQSLERLFHECLERLESALPPPDLQQLEEVVWRHAPSGPRPRELPILRRYLADVGHAHCGPVPRPLHSSPSPRPKPRPGFRRPRPLRAPPLEFVNDIVSDNEEEEPLKRKARPLPISRRAPPPSDADGERNRDRHRTHRQGGADQGAGGGEGGDPPPAAAPHLQRQADERREDGGRLQNPRGLRPPPRPGPAGGRGPAVRGRSSRRDTPPSFSPSSSLRGAGPRGHAHSSHPPTR